MQSAGQAGMAEEQASDKPFFCTYNLINFKINYQFHSYFSGEAGSFNFILLQLFKQQQKYVF